MSIGAPRKLRAGLGLSVVLGATLLISAQSGAAMGAHGPVDAVITPGENIQTLVDGAPAGTVFLLKSGIHRLQSIRPRDNDSFIGEPGTVLSGAKLLTEFRRENGWWVAPRQPQRAESNGQCAPGFEGCHLSEDLYIDDRPLRRVVKLEDLDPGTWFFDYDAAKIYLAIDPTGHRVETSVLRNAFYGRAQNVTIRDMVVEKYAVPAQFSAIDGRQSRNWTVESNDVRWNHGGGIRVGDGMRVLRNRVHDNGQIGISGMGTGILVEGNEIDHNNYAGFASGWEAGATKFVATDKLVVRANCVHDNKGFGLWTDGDNIHTLYERNRVFDNDDAGIMHEISFDAIIRDNQVARNGRTYDDWLWGSQILLGTSRNVEIYGNTIEVDARNGNGIGLIQQERGSGTHGRFETTNNYVHHNLIAFLGEAGGAGAVADWKNDMMFKGNNRFDFNIYQVRDMGRARWMWNDSAHDWRGFRQAGMEQSGAVDTEGSVAPINTCGPLALH